MELNVDCIHVDIDEEFDEASVDREIRYHLQRALEVIAANMSSEETIELEHLELPQIDWNSVVDKTGMLVRLIVDALERKTERMSFS